MGKKCRKCFTVKPIAEFNKNRSRPDGVQTWCRPCEKRYYRETGKAKQYYYKVKATDPERLVRYQRRTRMRNRYGITEEIYQQILAAQDERCAVCGEKRDYRLFVDHCHAENRVRGLLCSKCNGALGWYEKRRAEIHAYLERRGELWPTPLTSTKISTRDCNS